MDRRIFLPFACVFLALPGAAFAVNLVPNPGFETYVSCPTGFSQLFQAPSVNVPANTFGFQVAPGGVGYGGFLVRNFGGYHEYVHAPLTSPLAAAPRDL